MACFSAYAQTLLQRIARVSNDELDERNNLAWFKLTRQPHMQAKYLRPLVGLLLKFKLLVQGELSNTPLDFVTFQINQLLDVVVLGLLVFDESLDHLCVV